MYRVMEQRAPKKSRLVQALSWFVVSRHRLATPAFERLDKLRAQGKIGRVIDDSGREVHDDRGEP